MGKRKNNLNFDEGIATLIIGGFVVCVILGLLIVWALRAWVTPDPI
jgi:hypothetical protein